MTREVEPYRIRINYGIAQKQTVYAVRTTDGKVRILTQDEVQTSFNFLVKDAAFTRFQLEDAIDGKEAIKFLREMLSDPATQLELL